MFGKKPPSSSTIDTLIGSGTTVTGDLAFRGGLHLDGRIVGDLTSEQDGAGKLTIGAAGLVEGSVGVDNLVLNGAVRGDVLARERVELGPTAQVDGNVSYKVLQMAAGARVNGRLIHQPGGQMSLPAPPAEETPDRQASPEGDEIPGVR